MRRLPLAEVAVFRAPARRTRALGIVLAAALVALVVGLVRASDQPPPASDILPPGASAIVVLDLSGSTRSYPAPIANALRELTADGRRRLGLIVFSDSAYEALPPDTPVEGLRGWLDEFEHSQDPRYPWGTFSGGTAISSGLALARHVLRRDGIRHPHVLLVTDLVDDDTDVDRLASIVEQYQRDRIDLRVISVTGIDQGMSSLAKLTIHNAAFVTSAASTTIDPTKTSPQHTTLALLAVLLVALALVATAFELAFHPLDWGRTA
jgi:hypothetical protein